MFTNDPILLKDSLDSRDMLRFEEAPSKKVFRTEIIGGYDLDENPTGKSTLGETLFETENQIVIGGALFTLEKLFGVNATLQIDTLNTIMNIATTGAPITDVPYPKDNIVCLFGVGIGGSGDTIASTHDVKFHEREIVDMIPFRVTADALSSSDATKYWFKKASTIDPTKTQYFLKTFESTPTIKALWKDAEGDEDGTEVENGVHNTSRTEPIETFVEIILKISKKDCREFFELNGNVDKTRINSIALFTGVKSTLADSSQDFKQVKMFSKLNINNEMLVLAKDLTIIYRIYTS